MADRPVDLNLRDVLDDVRYLLARVRAGDKDVASLAAGYMIVNRPLLDRVLEGWSVTSEREMRALQQYPELDYAVAQDAFSRVTAAPLLAAPESVLLGRQGIGDEDLQMLERVLDYAQYVRDTGPEPPRWHPVADVEPAEVERLRDSIAADESGPALLEPSNATGRALSFALLLPAASDMAAAATFVGALQLPRAGFGHTVAAVLSEHFAERLSGAPVAERARAEIGATDSPGLEDVKLDAIVSSPLVELYTAASAIARRAGAELTHLRHLLAAVLTTSHDGSLDRVIEALGSDVATVRQRLRGAVTGVDSESAAFWDQVLGFAAPVLELPGGQTSDAVPARGIPLSRDHLDVGAYVSMLATVIAGDETQMPLSIGLFGEWGSGKSYFMGLLRDQVTTLSGRNSKTYKRDIRQISFNAWHYADTNLWASLGDEIFAQLARTGEDGDKAKQKALRDELVKTLEVRHQLERAQTDAEAETTRLTKDLEAARADRARSLVSLAQAAATRNRLDSIFKALGIQPQVEQGELLLQSVRGTLDEVGTLRTTLAGRRGPLLVAVAAAAIVLVVAAAALPWELGRVGAIAALVPVLGTAARIAGRVQRAVGQLNDVAAEIRTKADENQAADLEAVRKSEANARALQTRVNEVAEREIELQRQIDELDPGQRLYRFIVERASGDVYRRHLGLISTVRKDFEQLAALMKQWSDERTATPEPIDRIVLYIDDLDRCPPEQVVTVLQAVHLLLALDLFVVVVGVDPRWLLRSLRRQYESILTSDGHDQEWETTPLDYLEKIFNIPFTLPAMTPTAFRGLLEGIASESPAPAAPVRAAPSTPTVPTTAVPVADVPVEAGSETAAAQVGAAAPDVRPLQRGELDLLAALAPLVGSPREGKRLLNLYRMIRSTRNLSAAERFLGDWSYAGDHQAVIVLLGLLAGHGRFTQAVLAAPAKDGAAGGLMHRPTTTTWSSFAEGLAPTPVGDRWRNGVLASIEANEVGAWAALAAGLEPATALVKLPDLSAFQLWAPRVARFSFLSTALVLEDR
jgi:hypothetical protein